MKKLRFSINKQVINLLAKQIDDYYDPDHLRIDVNSKTPCDWSNDYDDYDIYYTLDIYLIMLGKRIGIIEKQIQSKSLRDMQKRY